jgi:hypothetical protein
MDIGDNVIYGGERFYVRGVDPAGVDPRFIYLEDARTGKTISVTFEASRRAGGDSTLRLVDTPDRLDGDTGS